MPSPGKRRDETELRQSLTLSPQQQTEWCTAAIRRSVPIPVVQHRDSSGDRLFAYHTFEHGGAFGEIRHDIRPPLPSSFARTPTFLPTVSAQCLAGQGEVVGDRLSGDAPMRHQDLADTSEAEEGSLAPILESRRARRIGHRTAKREGQIPRPRHPRRRKTRMQQGEVLRQGSRREAANERIIEIVVLRGCVGDDGGMRFRPALKVTCER